MSATPRDAFHRQVLLAAVAVHVITAWFSGGFYAADEHYQVIAFAQHKLGDLSAEELPWEYDARIRSGFLPGIAYAVIGACRSLITANPFHITFLLRLLTAFFALVVVRAFVRSAMEQVSEHLLRPFILLSYFLWFLPYQHVRFAAETWSGLLFILGLAHLLGKDRNSWNMLAAGLCFGLSLQVKPAMCIAVAGAIAWMLSAEKDRRTPWFPMLAGLVLALISGVLVDRWFYGDHAISLWNYLRLAVVGDPAHTFETYPWYYYVPWMMKYAIWPIGLVLIGALLWLTWRQPRAWAVWCVWPYLIVLSLIPHKELRFLFPLVDLTPLVLVLAWQEAGNAKLARAIKYRAVIIPLIVINASGLVVSSTTAAGSGRTRLAGSLWNAGSVPTGSLGYDLIDDRIWKARIPSFYLPPEVEDIGINAPCTLANGPPPTSTSDLLIAEEDRFSSCTPEGLGYRPLARSESKQVTILLDLYNSDRSRPYLLYAHENRISHPSDP